MPKVRFFGLCGIGAFQGEMWAIMPPGGDHKTTLLIRARHCVLKKDGDPDPEFIAHDAANEQWLGFDVAKRELQFKDASGNAQWKNTHREQMIDLGAFHSGAKTKRPSGVAAFRLTAGELTATDKQNFKIKHKGTTKEGSFGGAATWEGSGKSVVDKSGAELVEVASDATLVISNLAAVLNGEKHFHMYYDLFFDKVPDDPITIEHSNVTVYDCVPPVPLP